MRTPLIQAARQVGVHPFNLLLRLSASGMDLEDVWPEIDESWLETVRTPGRERVSSRPPAGHTEPTPAPRAAMAAKLSRPAEVVIEKLWRGGRWRVAAVSFEQLQKHTHLETPLIEQAVAELTRLGLLSGNQHGPFSLNSARKAEIQQIAEQAIQTKASSAASGR